KAFNNEGEAYLSDVLEAIQYVIDNDIRLSNNSWAGVNYSQALYDMIAQALATGHLFVVAAGNFFGRNIDENPVYPASLDLPNILTVASIDNDDRMPMFTSIGPASVDLSAPGANIYSTVPGSLYDYSHGTPMSAAHVTGVAALLMSRRPDLNWWQVKDRILRTTRPVEAMMHYTVTGGSVNAQAAVGDCNDNGILDEQDIATGTSADCNADELPDECEPDCNDNGVPDDCDIDDAFSDDCNGNAAPDECDIADGISGDCNTNEVPDECDLLSGASDDVNQSGVPDECETCSDDPDCDDGEECTSDQCIDELCYVTDNTAACDDGIECTENDVCSEGDCEGTLIPGPDCAPIYSLRATALNSTPLPGGATGEITITRGDWLTLEVYVERWLPRSLTAYNALIDGVDFTSGSTGRLFPPDEPDPHASRFIDVMRADWMFFDRPAVPAIWIGAEATQYAGYVVLEEACAVDSGSPAYLGTLVLEASETASGTFTLCLYEDTINTTFLMECGFPFALISEFNFECLTVHVPLTDCTGGPDCNNNGQWDICDIFEGVSPDCNRNDVPDECDLAQTTSDDCNDNTIPDECDLADGTSTDCNENNLLDDCEADEDCNANSAQDICDIFAGASFDCNLNNVPDECEVFFVRADATGADNGTSWSDAYTDLQNALADASETCGSGVEIWVAAGIYSPAGPGGDRTATFRLINGVAIYGGFAGNESSVAERDPSENMVIFSGDLNGDDEPDFANRADNVYHVFTTSSTNLTALLDGFTISGGHADGGRPDNNGGGVFNDGGSPSLLNGALVDNYAANDGGGMFNAGGAELLNCAFLRNYAAHDGGALVTTSSFPILTNCVFSGNSAASNGGAVRLLGGNTVFADCTLSKNSAGRTLPTEASTPASLPRSRPASRTSTTPVSKAGAACSAASGISVPTPCLSMTTAPTVLPARKTTTCGFRAALRA
ncbi:MAG: S8 family serine peptidase, partial [Planctomycetota bacterium]